MKLVRTRRLLVVGLILSSVIALPANLYATNAQQRDIMLQGITDFNVDDCTLGSGGGLAGDAATAATSENAKAIFLFLISNNFTRNNNQPMNAVQAAGALANFQMESNLNPGTVEDTDSTTKVGHGIAQWTGGRWNGGGLDSLQGFASSKNKDWFDLGVQLEFIKYELDNVAYWGDAVWGDGEPTVDGLFWPNFKNATDPTIASEAWTRRMERPKEKYYQARKATQFAAAQNFYQQFSSLAPSVSTSTSTGAACSGPNDSLALANGTIESTARTMAGWGGTYIWGGGHGSIGDLRSRIDARFAGQQGVDCSGFVRASIYIATGTDIGSFTADPDNSTSTLSNNKYMTKLSNISEAQPGDVFLNARQTHVGIILENNGTSFTTAESFDKGKGMGIGNQLYSKIGAVYRFNGGS